MFLVSILWSFTGVLHKIGIAHSNAFAYGAIATGALLGAFTILGVSLRGRNFVTSMRDIGRLKQLAPAGALDAFELGAQMLAQSALPAAYVIALKRASVVFSIFLGKAFFGESIKGRILPAIIVIIGIALISFYGR